MSARGRILPSRRELTQENRRLQEQLGEVDVIARDSPTEARAGQLLREWYARRSQEAAP